MCEPVSHQEQAKRELRELACGVFSFWLLARSKKPAETACFFLGFLLLTAAADLCSLPFPLSSRRGTAVWHGSTVSTVQATVFVAYVLSPLALCLRREAAGHGGGRHESEDSDDSRHDSSSAHSTGGENHGLLGIESRSQATEGDRQLLSHAESFHQQSPSAQWNATCSLLAPLKWTSC